MASSEEKNTCSVKSTNSDDKRPQFGNRFLTNPQNVFEHNAWDDVVWGEDQETEARQVTEEQIKHRLDANTKEKYETEAGEYWNSFYGQHQNRFFKDRHWLFTEFPELATANCHGNKKDNSTDSSNQMEEAKVDISENELSTSESYPGENAKFRILEVGCGVGNTVFPVLQTNNGPDLMVYCCDFSSTAIQIVREHVDYDVCRCHAFVYDITSDWPLPFPHNSLDVITLIFVLSAISPDKMQQAVTRLAEHLKPGGVILFRDYGRYDMAQLRFKKGRCLSENFYVRGDGTRVYFFTQDELRSLFTKAGLLEEQNSVDRRLQVNRGRQLKMYRVWIQCKYRKPLGQATEDVPEVDSV
ncbi:tRNA N(3)-methylcytidine methyltransferase METTL2-like [Liolophura sinensis]|uniref:tRNA N(3)-methylcytidine methyltransferase METTL2-like n=1 Tax=Liolophura sinensis TaxID=3198878 RepID=UPI00315851F7